MCKHQVVEFQGEEYILACGVIATVEQYEMGTLGFAVLSSDGRIMQDGEQIGTTDDLTFTGKSRELTFGIRRSGLRLHKETTCDKS